MQSVAFPSANVPGGQPTQALPLTAVPGGQSSGMHLEEPADDQVPLAQGVHASADGSEKVLMPMAQDQRTPKPSRHTATSSNRPGLGEPSTTE